MLVEQEGTVVVGVHMEGVGIIRDMWVHERGVREQCG